MIAGRGAQAKVVVDICRRVYAKGWVANHDGNLTVRLDDGRLLATPTAWSKGDIDEASLLVTDMSGKRVSGTTRPFSELSFHIEAYKRRADARAVLHAHPPHATALACAGRALGRPFIAEAIVSLGDDVPLVPYAAPGQSATTAIGPFLERVDAVLIENHGVLTLGVDAMQAFLRMELVEHLARIFLAAAAVGGVRAIPDGDVPALVAARAKAGLGPRPAAPATPSAPSPVSTPPAGSAVKIEPQGTLRSQSGSGAASRAREANAAGWAPETRRHQ